MVERGALARRVAVRAGAPLPIIKPERTQPP